METNQTKGVLVETAMISLKKIPLYMINWGIQGFDNFHDWKEIIFRILIQWALDNWFCKSWRPKGHASIQPSTCGYYVSRLWECHIAVVRWMLRYPIPEGKLLLHPQSKLKLFFLADDSISISRNCCLSNHCVFSALFLCCQVLN